jgi:hypothetical protein
VNKIITISLAFILLISNLGLALGTHICCGEAVKSSLTVGHSHMADMDKDCPEEGKHLKAEVCCEDKYQPLLIEDDHKPGIIQTNDLNLVIAFVQVFLNLNFPEKTEHDFLTYLKSSPLQSDKDIIILVQSFLL